MLPILPELQSVIVELLDPKSFSMALSVSTQWRYTMEHTRIYPQFTKTRRGPTASAKVIIAVNYGLTWILSYYPITAKQIFIRYYCSAHQQDYLESVRWFFEDPNNEDVFPLILKLYIGTEKKPMNSRCDSPHYGMIDGIIGNAAFHSIKILKYLYGFIKSRFSDKLTKEVLHMLFILCCVKGDLELINDVLSLADPLDPFNIFDSVQNYDAIILATYGDNIEVINHLLGMNQKLTDPNKIFLYFLSALRMKKFDIADLLIEFAQKHHYDLDFEKRIWDSYIGNLSPGAINYLVNNKMATWRFFIGCIKNFNDTHKSYYDIVGCLINIIYANNEKMDNQLLVNLFEGKHYSIVEQFFSNHRVITKDHHLENLAIVIKQNLENYIKRSMQYTIIYMFKNFGAGHIENSGRVFMLCIKYKCIQLAWYLVKHINIPIYANYLTNIFEKPYIYYDIDNFEKLILKLRDNGIPMSPEFIDCVANKERTAADTFQWSDDDDDDDEYTYESPNISDEFETPQFPEKIDKMN